MPVSRLLRKGIQVKNDGVVVAENITCLDFVGEDDVEAVVDPSDPNCVRILHPAPQFRSCWNDTGGTNGAQFVTESISRTLARIANPSGGQGSPFNTSGWQDTNQDATLDGTVVLTTPSETTGFGGDSKFYIAVFDADGLTILDDWFSPALTGDGVHVSPSGRITLTISLYGPDEGTAFKAKAEVSVDMAGLFADNGLDGGRYHIQADHITDSSQEFGTCSYVQPDVFLDTNATTPSISGAVSVQERAGSVLTKHISGIEYYINGSEFEASVENIDQLNRNTARTTGNLNLDGSELGLPVLDHSPFGTGSGNFSSWNINHDTDGADYDIINWAISAANFRLACDESNVSAFPRDTWGSGAPVNSPNQKVLIDTYGVTSTDLVENFDDEARREFVDGVGASASGSSFAGAGTFDSVASLAGTTQAAVFSGKLITPNQTHYIGCHLGTEDSCPGDAPNADWSTYKPDLNGVNPDYSLLSVPVDYGRRFTQGAGSIPSFQIQFFGNCWKGTDALADLINGDLEIYVYRIARAGTVGAFGPPPTNTQPLRAHLPFNFADYDDGLTLAGSGIREGSSSGNTINCTFGTGTPAEFGMYLHIRILDPNIAPAGMQVTFF